MIIHLMLWAGLIYNYLSSSKLSPDSRALLAIIPTVLLVTALADHFLLAALGDSNLMRSDGSFAATVIAFVLLVIMAIFHAFSLSALLSAAFLIFKRLWRGLSGARGQFALASMLTKANAVAIYFYYFFRNTIHPLPVFSSDITVAVKVIQSDFVRLLLYPKLLLGIVILVIIGWIVSLFDVDF